MFDIFLDYYWYQPVDSFTLHPAEIQESDNKFTLLCIKEELKDSLNDVMADTVVWVLEEQRRQQEEIARCAKNIALLFPRTTRE